MTRTLFPTPARTKRPNKVASLWSENIYLRGRCKALKIELANLRRLLGAKVGKA